MEREKILVLGVGNQLMGDDGAGPAALAMLEKTCTLPSFVDLVEGGTMGLYLIDRIASYKFVIVLDSVILDEPPGTVVRIDGEEIGSTLRSNLSPHQMGIIDLLSALTLMEKKPAHIVVIGVAASAVGLCLAMSAEVTAALPKMVAETVLVLNEWGGNTVLNLHVATQL